MRWILYLLIVTLSLTADFETGTRAQTTGQGSEKQISAQSAYDEGERLSRLQTAESMRKAIGKYETAASLWKEAGDERNQAAAFSRAGRVNYGLGEYRQALDFLGRSLQLRQALNDREDVGATLNDLGVVYFSLGETQKALEYYRQALLIYAGSSTEDEASTLNNIGAVFRVMGDSQQALDYFKQGLSLRQALKDQKGEANSLSNIGALYFRMGDPQQALDYYELSLPLRRKAGDRAGEGITLTHMGSAQLALGDAQKALASLNQALVLVQGGQSRSSEAQTLNILGFASSTLGENEQALEYFRRALTLWRAIEEPQGEASALIRMGTIFREQGKTQLAVEHLGRALELARVTGELNTQAAALAALARVDRDSGNLDRARSRIEESLDLVESLRAKARADDLRLSFLSSKHGDYEFYVDLLMRLHEGQPGGGFDALAFEASERARGRNLLDIINSTRADLRRGGDQALLDQQRALQRQINATERFRAQAAARGQADTAATAERELRALLAEHQEVQSKILARNPRYAALTEPTLLKLKTIQEQLIGTDTLLLEYSLGEERSFLWIVSPVSLRVFLLPGRVVIEAATRRAYQRLTLSRKSEYAVSAALAAAELSRMVLGPAAADLGQKRLVIVSDGVLQYVPFGALPEPATKSIAAGKRKPLIVDHEVVSLPSASVLMAMRREQSGTQPATRSVAVFSDPVFSPNDPRVKQAKLWGEGPSRLLAGDGGNKSKTGASLLRSAAEAGIPEFGRLPYSRQEAEAILALAPAETSFKALDFAASRATVFGAGLDAYRVVHFATHGLLNSLHPELSGIVLSLLDEQGRPQEGFLRMHEIYTLKLNADLVVLSACSTALGKEVKGEGIVGLTSGFMYAGTPRVLASLWNVRDKATAELMKRFYRHLLVDKLSPAAALRQAQVSMSREPRWAAPYYWAGFVLQGEWQ